MKKYDIYGIGAALVDMEFEVDDAFLQSHGIEKGIMTLVEPEQQAKVIESLNGRSAKKASGGSAANTVIASSYFGASAFYSCKAACDATGDFFVNDIQNAGVDCNLGEVREEGTSGTCLVMITPDAERTMNTYLGISESLGTSELDLDALQNASYFYMEGYLSTSDSGRAAAIKGRTTAEAHDTKTVLTFSDPAMVQFFKPQLQEMLGDGVDHLFCNQEEALLWADTDDLDSALEALKLISKTFAVTLGAEGALVFDGSQQIRIAPHAVKAIDSNGAGDMFAGAFLYAMSQGKTYEQAGKLASLASSKVVSQFGPRLSAEDHQPLLKEIF